MRTRSKLWNLVVQWVTTGTIPAPRYSGSTTTQVPTGASNSGSLLVRETSPEQQPSIERSKTSSTVSITLQANPDRPLAYTVERWNGGERLRKLTVVYEQSQEGLASAIVKSDASASPPRLAPLSDVNDPAWTERVRSHDMDDGMRNSVRSDRPLAYPPGGRPLL